MVIIQSASAVIQTWLPDLMSHTHYTPFSTKPLDSDLKVIRYFFFISIKNLTMLKNYLFTLIDRQTERKMDGRTEIQKCSHYNIDTIWSVTSHSFS